MVHFTATAICPDAPHTVVFYEQVEGDVIALEGTWTTRRWYWTNQIFITATGELVSATSQTSARRSVKLARSIGLRAKLKEVIASRILLPAIVH